MNPLDMSPRGEWSAVRVDAVATVRRETVEPSVIGSSNVLHLSIPAFDETGSGVIEPASAIGSAKLRCSGGEVLVSRLNPRKSRVLRAPSDSPYPILASGEFVVLQLAPEIATEYAVYMFQSEAVRQYLDSETRSVTRSHQRVAPAAITKMWFRLPPFDEQRRIVGFLDEEIANIDRALGARHQLLDLLRERDRSVVAVLLDSAGGADRRLGQIATTIGGTGFPHAYQGLSNGDLPFIKVSDMHRDGASVYVNDAENWITYEVATELGARMVPQGAVVFPKVGAALLKNHRRLTGRPCVIDNNIMALVSHSVSPRFLRYALLGIDFGRLANPGPVPSLNAQQVRDLSVRVPRQNEQERIADQLDQRLAEHAHLRALASRQLDLLLAHRNALITAAVTGQIDPSSYRRTAVAA